MNFTIKKRLLLSNVAGLAFVVIVGAIGYHGAYALDQAMDAISLNGATMKDQLQADQAHDALRADVMAALLANASDDEKQRGEANKDADEHIAVFEVAVGKLGCLKPADEAAPCSSMLGQRLDVR